MGRSRESAGVRGQTAAKLHRVPRGTAVEMARACRIITQIIYHEIRGGGKGNLLAGGFHVLVGQSSLKRPLIMDLAVFLQTYWERWQFPAGIS